ncbi:MAG: 3-hydroxyacyl-CoA dehydrogenase family protein [Heliomarina sp.]|uniref:3-hydroxyacyl-CoA dehydrogenase family protein n=1 Tax=Heliomarina sp. TaxID=2917556 RepID=UPI00405A243E
MAEAMRRMVIIGSGAEAIALASLGAKGGYDVVVFEEDAASAERFAVFLRHVRGEAVQVTAEIGALKSAEIVVEATDLPRAARINFHRNLEAQVPGNALICCVDREVTMESPLGNCVGLHLAAPAHLRRLAEITPDRQGNCEEAVVLAKELGRKAIICPRDSILLSASLEQAWWASLEYLQMRGAVPHEIDEALVAEGFAMGPHEAQDLVGTEVAYADRRRRGDDSQLIADRMVEEGRLGKKVGVGWYRYPGGGGAVIDPLVEDLIREEAHFARVEQRSFSEAEIVGFLQQALFEAGRKTGASSELIETVGIHGLGLPPGWINWSNQSGSRNQPGKNSI